MNTLKILLKTKNFGSIQNSLINKNNFIKFNKDYCHNLTRYNYNIKNVSVFEDTENSNFLSEIELDISAESFIGVHEKNIMEKLKQDDLFYLFRRKYYENNLYLKINYLKPQKITDILNHNQDIFLL